MGDNGVLRLLQARLGKDTPVPFELKLWDGLCYHFGEGEPSFQVKINDPSGLAALSRMDLRQIAEAYMAGALDLAGDMLKVLEIRGFLTDQSQWWHRFWKHLSPLLLGQVKIDRQAIAQHYEFDHDLFLSFLDPTRCYSHALFEQDQESLEVAQHRKLEFALKACHVQPGERVLDVGGGWGTFTEYAGQQGIQVTSLTISNKSTEFLNDLISKQQLPCQVLNQNFFEHQSAVAYDAIAILGVIEHLPNYPAVLKQLSQLVKPGGRVYLDASATRYKHQKDAFISRYIYPGNHSFLCLHDFLKAVADSPFEVLAVYNDRHNYFLTCKAWAENFDRAQEQIIHRWGEEIYRMFRLYLWGSAHAFYSRGLDAYRVILERKHSDISSQPSASTQNLSN